MKIRTSLLFLFTQIFLFTSVSGQNCSSHDLLQKAISENPEIQLGINQLEAETQAYILANQDRKRTQSTKVIPVVFHVIHNGGSENISVAQIRNQMTILNAEFQRMFADTFKTPAPFKPLAGTIDVEFRLASLDPNGNCTQGITRTYHPFSICSPNEQDVKALVYWPSNKYLNIWLVSSMHYEGQSGCGGGGYAQFPGNGQNPLTDGINIRGDLIGSIGTAMTNSGWGNFQGRYLIHELGHWFNLRHIWGDQTCGDDLVSDTPPHQQSNSGCPTFPWRPNNSCGSDANGEMFTNYMDYTNGPCLNVFSKQQALRAEAAISGTASGRSNLWSSTNLAATGTETATISNCPAVPELFPYVPKFICNSGVTTLRDASYGGTKTARLWNVAGGQASSLTDSIISVTYSNPGVYSVDLTTTNPQGSISKTFYDRVIVLDNTEPANSSVPFSEGFESSGMPEGWTRINTGNDTTWQITGVASTSGSNSIRIKNFSNVIGGIDELISPRFDLSNLSSATLKFQLAFARRKTSNKDRLVITISKDCGQTWTSVYNKLANNSTSGNELSTISNTTLNFTPLNSGDWREETITLASTYRTNNIRFRFTFTSSGGNNLYIDDFKLDGTVVVSNRGLTDVPTLDLAPNPGHQTIRLLGLQDEATLIFQDVTGKIILKKTIQFDEEVSIGKLPAGLYIWSAETRHGKAAGKWIKD